MANTAWVGLANNALVMIGVRPIADFTDQSKEARYALTLYQDAKRAVLRMHDWNFAKVQLVLTQLSNVPTINYSNAYQLPIDCLRVLNAFLTNGTASSGNMNVSSFPYQIYGRQLFCSQVGVAIEYIQDIQDPTVIDPICFEAMSIWLAMKLSFAMLQSQEGRNDLNKMFSAIIEKAKTIDSLENSNTEMDAELLLQSRFNYPSSIVGSGQAPNVSSNPY